MLRRAKAAGYQNLEWTRRDPDLAVPPRRARVREALRPVVEGLDPTPRSQSGLRFSRKAFRPSWPSAEARRSAMIRRRSTSRTSSVGRPATPRSSAFGRGDRARRRLQQLAHALVDRGVELASRARRGGRGRSPPPAPPGIARRSGTARARRTTPILRTTYGEMTAGTRPSRTSVKPNCAPSAATATSATATSPRRRRAPRPARARPRPSASGRSSRTARRARARRPGSRSRVKPATVFIQSRSAPAQKTVPRPPSTITRTSSRAEAPAIAAVSSAPSPRRRRCGPRAARRRRARPGRRPRSSTRAVARRPRSCHRHCRPGVPSGCT